MQHHRAGPSVLGESAGEQVHAVELGMACDAVDFGDKLGYFHLDHHTIAFGENTVGRLNSEFPDTVQNILGSLEETFGGLYKGHAVHDVALGLVKAPDLAPHLFGYRKPGGIVPGAVDPHTGTKLLHAPVDANLYQAKLAVGEHGTQIVVNNHI